MLNRSPNKNVWLLLLFLFVILLFLGFNPPYVKENFESSCGEKCGEDNLLPIMDPMYNMREFCKQSILLEDHLTHARKNCTDCKTKHMLTLEALAEEACTLDKENTYKDILLPLPDKCRKLQKRLYAGEDQHLIAQEYRKIRKELMPLCKNNF